MTPWSPSEVVDSIFVTVSSRLFVAPTGTFLTLLGFGAFRLLRDRPVLDMRSELGMTSSGVWLPSELCHGQCLTRFRGDFNVGLLEVRGGSEWWLGGAQAKMKGMPVVMLLCLKFLCYMLLWLLYVNMSSCFKFLVHVCMVVLCEIVFFVFILAGLLF